MKVHLIVGNHQEKLSLPEGWLSLLESKGDAAVQLVKAQAVDSDSPIFHLATIEVAFVDDETSARVHEEFMHIPGETDVITFHHGEIVIGVEVAQRQAADYEEPLARELLRYLVHGLLHLAGHDDQSDDERARMETAQEAIVAELWCDTLLQRFS